MHTDAWEKACTFSLASHGPAPSLSPPSLGYWARLVHPVCWESQLPNSTPLDTWFCLASAQAPLGAQKACWNLRKHPAFQQKTQYSCSPDKIKPVLKSASKFWCLHLKFLSLYHHVVSAFHLDSKDAMEKGTENWDREQREAGPRKTWVSERSRSHESLNRFYKTLGRSCNAADTALGTRGTEVTKQGPIWGCAQLLGVRVGDRACPQVISIGQRR